MDDIPVVKCDGCRQYTTGLRIYKYTSDKDPSITEEWLMCAGCIWLAGLHSAEYAHRIKKYKEETNDFSDQSNI